jgi:uncharacterized membrane protein
MLKPRHRGNRAGARGSESLGGDTAGGRSGSQGKTTGDAGHLSLAGHEGGMSGTERSDGHFPISAGILFGLGLGGFFDGIVLHQVLQWHHMLTNAGYPANSVANLQVNTFWDGVFHASTYIFVLLGLAVLWRTAHRTHVQWSGKLLAGTMLMGFGIFNLVEGVIDHHILGIHHVNETVSREHWVWWDLGFLSWGAVMFVGGWVLLRRGRQETPRQTNLARSGPKRT